MSNFDDWGAENKDWDSSEGNSDFDFAWDPEGNFQHVAQPKKSRVAFVKQQPLWIKIAAGVTVGVVVLFVFLQVGGITKLRTLGVLRESISAEAMCLNGLQVVGELSIGVFNTAVMNRAIDHADRVKSQRSGDLAVDEAAWSVADSAYLVQEVIRSIPGKINSADMMLGDRFDALNSDGLEATSLAVAQASENLSAACGSAAEDVNSLAGGGALSPVTPSESLENLTESDSNSNSEVIAEGSLSESSLSENPSEISKIDINSDDNDQAVVTSDNDEVPDESTSDSEIAFLTFNVCHSECKDPAPAWNVRNSRIAKVIVDSNVDVVGLQEVTNWQVDGATTQWGDIQRLLAADGFIGPKVSDQYNICTKSNRQPCVDTARILFDSKRLEQLNSINGLPAAGYSTLEAIAPGIELNASNRTVAWAYLREFTGKPFLAMSLHMDSDRTVSAEDARRDVAEGLNLWVEDLNRSIGIDPSAVVLMADLNSYDARQSDGAQTVLRQQGWTDAWNAPDKRNVMYSTINYTPDTQHYGGWPPRPRPFSDIATRIDYIFSRGNADVVDYEVMLWLNPDGTFDADYQASDHQSVRATLAM